MNNLLDLLTSFAKPDLTPGYLREFHAEVMRAIEDGKLTEEEIESLEKRKEELGLSDEALGAVRQDSYVAAFNAVKRDTSVTDDEWLEMEKIQDFLNLKDSDIAKSKRELYRLRILTEIRAGNLPVISSEGLATDDDELAHWSEKVEVLEPPENAAITGKTMLGIDAWKKLDAGAFIITSKRIVIKGKKKTIADRLSRIVQTDFFTNGLLLHVNGRSAVFLRYARPGDHNVVASVLLAAMSAARAH